MFLTVLLTLNPNPVSSGISSKFHFKPTVHIKASLLKKQTKSQQDNDKYSNKKHDALKTKQNKTKHTVPNNILADVI
jgi:hypothetical protein